MTNLQIKDLLTERVWNKDHFDTIAKVVFMNEATLVIVKCECVLTNGHNVPESVQSLECYKETEKK